MSDSLLPYAVGAAKRARRVAVRMRRRVERLHTAPALGSGIRPRPLLRPVHFSVLGGRTMNVALLAPGALAIASANLELIRGGQRHRIVLESEPQSDGSRLLTATTALAHADHPETGTSGIALSSGLWRMSVVIVGEDGREMRAGVAAATVRTTDGPTLPVSPSPRSGAQFRLMRSVDGLAILKVRAPDHQAELDSFDLRWDRITVRGRLIASHAAPTSYAAQAVRRGSGAVVEAPVEWRGDAFTFDLPLAAMASGRRTQRWDVQLQHGRTRLKIARRLTDVRRRNQVFRTSFRIIALENGSLLRVHAYITSAGALAVSCAEFEGAHDGAKEVA
ncbi:hypothetical protein [Streptomyces sp. NPDC046182]|uniref:hypothetical protein n=1 Tax=Streptomyces sp. NPDC046182 TaxID=3154601 RepID=UPI0034058A04